MMDPATLTMAIEGISTVIGIVQQAQSGTMTDAQAQSLLSSAFSQLKTGIDAFNSAVAAQQASQQKP